MRGPKMCLLLPVFCVLLVPGLGFAQSASLAGIVRDSSGSVIPGVTVEATSDALIDRTRTTVTDGTGQWRIIDLRPGLYTVTFSLAGFSRVVREGIEVTGSAVTTISAELQVGNLQESITVTGDPPAVSIQSAKREVVLQGEYLASLPATRNYSAILASIPAIDFFGNPVSAQTTPEMQLFSARGGSSNEGRVQIDGMTVAAAFNGGGVSSFTYNTADATEMQVNISGGLAESETGGPVMNLIPRSGGNRYSGSAFWSGAGDWSRSENIDDELRSYGITRGPALKNSWDVSGSLGGPIKRDRLWFFGTIRNFGSGRVIEAGASPNLYAGDPTRWDYAPDTAITEILNLQSREVYSGRVTGQFGSHRLSFSQENQYRCDGSTRTPQGDGCRQQKGSSIGLGNAPSVFGYNSPEAHAGYFPSPYYLTQVTWTMPMTSRVLLEAGYTRFAYMPVFGQPPSDGVFDIISVQEQAAIDGHRANFRYRAIDTYNKNWANPNNYRASLSYVTGAHNMKFGYQGAYQISDETLHTNPSLISYRFNQRVPNQFTIRLPDWQEADRTVQHSAFIQDQWTVKRLTLQGGIRYDHAYSWSPAEHNGTTATSQWNAQPITFPRTVSVRGFNDITPRMGVAYDLFGTGKTSLKANFGKYLDAATNDSNYTENNPANRIQTTLSRGWTDNDGDRVVDCDILNPVAQSPTTTGHVDTCAATTGNSLRFANSLTGLDVVNPAILGGWGVRGYDWQFGVAIQQEVLPRVSVEVAYNRRWWGNFTVTENQALGANDFETWIATAPLDPRLPGGGGYNIVEYEVTPEAAGRSPQNYVTFETDFGPARTNYWHGIEVTGNARMRNGLTFQGGTSTGREVEDQCELYSNYTRVVLNVSTRNPRNCRTVDPFRTTFRGSASYIVPKLDVLVSSSVRIQPPSELIANYNFPNTYVAAQLGHLPAGGTATGNQLVNLLDENQMYGDNRHYQVDMRFAKIFRFGGRRLDVGADLYNIFNLNTPTFYDGTYDVEPAPGLGPGGEWLRPTSIVQPRFLRFNVTFDF